MRKIWTITRKELQATFTDRTLLLLMFAAPLALATIIAVTFGSAMGGGSAPITEIPVAVVNLDAEGNGSNGQIVVDVLSSIPASQPQTEAESDNADDTLTSAEASADTTLLITVTALEDAEAARAGVEAGDYAAAVIIPADFTENVTFSPTNIEITPTRIEVYGDPQRPISVSIVRGVVTSIANQIATGNVAIAAVIQSLIDENPLLIGRITGSETFEESVAPLFSGEASLIRIEQQDVTGAEAVFNPLVVIGATQAIFFALFTANGGASSIIEERRNWTLQRLVISPTPRIMILFGKMLGTLVTVAVQLIILMIAFTLVASLLAGELQFIWGSDILGLVLVLVASAIAATGLGSIVAAAANSPEQAGTVGSVLALFMAVTGGTFGFSLGPPVAYFSIVYWGADGLSKVVRMSGDYWLNVAVMLAFGVVTFLIGLFIFNRKLND